MNNISATTALLDIMGDINTVLADVFGLSSANAITTAGSEYGLYSLLF